MSLRDRLTLKSFFSNGKLPTEGNFSDLIDSTVNKLDDKVVGSALNNNARQFIQFDKNKEQVKKTALWEIGLADDAARQALYITELNAAPAANKDNNIYFKPGGNIGVATNDPQYKLHVNGAVGFTARIGTCTLAIENNEVPANGQWTAILTNLKGMQAFEIMAAVNNNMGRAAMLHATALSVYGKSNTAISKTLAKYGGFWNSIKLRWTGDADNYSLEIKTTIDYGNSTMMKVFVTQLWCNE